MSVRDRSRLGDPCWVELMTEDTAAASRFYSSLLGWTTTGGDDGGRYITFWNDEERVAGLTVPHPGFSANAWLTYLSVSDVDATTARARDAGATVVVPETTVGDQGRMAVLMDPGGAAIGLWQSDQHTGYGRFGEVGTPVWHELITRDFGAATAFYASVLGWQWRSLGDTDEFRYSIAGPEGREAVGVYDARNALADGQPSHWALYIGVPDAAAAARRAADLGGRIVRDAYTSEYGTFAEITDPAGAALVLSSTERQAADGSD